MTVTGGVTVPTGDVTFDGKVLFNNQVAMKQGLSVLGPVTIKALPDTVALTLLGDNIPPIKEALAVDGNVRIGADRNGFRRNLIVTGQTTLGSGSPGTPIALTTRGGVDIKGHLRALTANFVGSVTVEGNLEVWRSVIARAYYWWRPKVSGGVPLGVGCCGCVIHGPACCQPRAFAVPSRIHSTALAAHPSSPTQPSKHIPFQAPAVVKKDLEANNITA